MKLLVSLCLSMVLSLIPLIARAEVVERRQISLRGKSVRVAVPAGTQKMEFYGISRGESTVAFAAGVVAPVGSVVKVRARYLRGGVGRALERGKNSFWGVDTANFGKGRRTAWTVNDGGQRTRARSVIPTTCSVLTPAQLKEVIAALEQFFGRPVSKDEACGYIFGGSSSGEESDEFFEDPSEGSSAGGSFPIGGGLTTDSGLSGSYSSLGLGGMLQKDACLSPKRSRYLLVVEVDLSSAQLDPNDEAFVEVGAEEAVYRGRKSSSIKPISDGKFAPKPLVLMQSTGVRPEEVELVKWRKRRPVERVGLRIENYLGYKGLFLARTVVDGYLNGGRATFEIKSPDRSGYGVCFDLDRRRQRVFGYPS